MSTGMSPAPLYNLPLSVSLTRSKYCTCWYDHVTAKSGLLPSVQGAIKTMSGYIYSHALTWVPQTTWNKGVTAINTWFKRNRTQPHLHSAILEWLKSIRSGILSNVVADSQLRMASHVQNEMGWEAVLTGCAATGWKTIQHTHFTQMTHVSPVSDGWVRFLQQVLSLNEVKHGMILSMLPKNTHSATNKLCTSFIASCLLLPSHPWDADTESLLSS